MEMTRSRKLAVLGSVKEFGSAVIRAKRPKAFVAGRLSCGRMPPT